MKTLVECITWVKNSVKIYHGMTCRGWNWILLSFCSPNNKFTKGSKDINSMYFRLEHEQPYSITK